MSQLIDCQAYIKGRHREYTLLNTLYRCSASDLQIYRANQTQHRHPNAHGVGTGINYFSRHIEHMFSNPFLTKRRTSTIHQLLDDIPLHVPACALADSLQSLEAIIQRTISELAPLQLAYPHYRITELNESLWLHQALSYAQHYKLKYVPLAEQLEKIHSLQTPAFLVPHLNQPTIELVLRVEWVKSDETPALNFVFQTPSGPTKRPTPIWSFPAKIKIEEATTLTAGTLCVSYPTRHSSHLTPYQDDFLQIIKARHHNYDFGLPPSNLPGQPTTLKITIPS